MIVTMTLNAALDRTVSVPNFHLQGRNRASESLSLPGGKGVNVARALRTLGEPVITTGLAGGRVGTYIIEELTAEGILNDFVRIENESRTSTAVIDPTGGSAQTEINEVGPVVAPAELATLFEKVAYLSKGGDVFVLAGSLPREVPQDIYGQFVRALKREKIVTVIDAAGPPLMKALKAGPDLVSPNTREAEELVGYELADAREDPSDAAAAAAWLVESGAVNAVIHGGGGCVARLRQADGRYVTYRAMFPLRPVVSTIGSGDSFLAGFVAAWRSGAPDAVVLARAVATGAANTQRMGAGRFDPDDVEASTRRVKVEVLD